MSALGSKAMCDKGILSDIDKVILESSQQTIRHKVWNNLFADWEDGDSFQQNVMGYAINIERADWDQILETVSDYQTRRNSRICDHEEECELYTDDLFSPLLDNSVSIKTNSNIEAAIWWELNVGPCFGRVRYISSPSRVLHTLSEEAWNDIDASKYSSEEQDQVIDILLDLDD